MNRRAKAFTSFVLVLALTSLAILEVGHLVPAGAVPAAARRAPSGPCIAAQPIKPALGGALVRRRVRHLVACSVRTWPVPGGVSMALCIARRESGVNLWPWSNSGSSKGTLQLNSNYFYGWRSRYWNRAWAPHLPGWFSPRGNVVIGIRMMHDVGLGPWGGGC